MAKVYIINDEDVALLRQMIARDPSHGTRGGAAVLGEAERRAHDQAYRFFNYQICHWIDKVTK